MSVDDIRELLHRDPFVPFRIILSSGTAYDVHDRHRVALGATQIIIYPDGSDRHAILRLNQITSIEVHQAA